MNKSTQAEEPLGIGFYLFLVFIFEYFIRLSSRFSFIGSMRPTLILIGLIILLILFGNKRYQRETGSDVTRIIITLIVYYFLSLPLVEYALSSIRDNFADWFKALSFFFFTIYLVDTKRKFSLLVGVFIATQTFRVLEPLYLNFTQGYWGDNTYLGNGHFETRLAGAPSDVINPNELGFVIVYTIGFLYYFWQRDSFLKKALFWTAIGLFCYALVLTMSRGAMVVLLVFLGFILRKSRYKFLFLSFGLVAGIAGWAQMDDVHKERYLSIVSSDTKFSSSSSGRIDGMIEEFELGLSRPVVGHGVGTTREAKYHAFGGYQVSHNMYAEILIEMGGIGLIIFISFMIKLNRCIKEIKVTSESVNQQVLGLQAVFWIFAVYSINYWGLTQYYWYFLAGLAVSLWNIQQQAFELETDKAHHTKKSPYPNSTIQQHLTDKKNENDSY